MFLKVIFIFSLFFLLTGSKIILKDGNFIEVSSYRVKDGTVFFEKGRERFVLPLEFIDITSTNRLKEIEGKKLSIFSLNSSILKEKTKDSLFRLKTETPDKTSTKNDFRIKLETRKETNPFFLEQPVVQQQDETPIERIKKKGLMLKIEVPLKKQ